MTDEMSIFVGIDIGAISVKAALLLPATDATACLARPDADGVLRRLAVPTVRDRAVLVVNPRRTRGRPLAAAREVLEQVTRRIPGAQLAGLMLTGSGGGLVADALDAKTVNEFQAAARAVDFLHPDVRTVFEIGGESSRYLRLEPDPASGRLSILDYSANGDCAAGTGGFIDQQAQRLRHRVEEIGTLVEGTQRAAQIAGRCSVFAKSDMIHAQQKGFAPSEVLRGLCHAVATNYKSAVVKGRTPVPPVALLGGVSANTAVVRSLREIFGLTTDQLLIPDAADSLGAVGAALAAADQTESSATTGPRVQAQLTRLLEAVHDDGHAFPRQKPLNLENVKLLRDQVRPYSFAADGRRVDAYLGLDIGSVGTKLVVIDDRGDVIHSIFTRTEGRPIEVVTRCLRELEEAVGWGVCIRAVGSTGSGRELIGELVGADAIHDEITCHKTGAGFVGDRLLAQRPDTIFEIGGQDSKYISLQAEGTELRPTEEGGRRRHEGTQDNPDGAPVESEPGESIVVDFTMNEACAAGTGSFLEERAEELGVSIKDEFAALALRSQAPIKLGERCTVFMERDVNTYMQRGARLEDIIAGLAYSVAYNYINRVVRGRPIGETIFFQGGTAHNDAVAAAFSSVTGKTIIVPPHNAVLGAIGAALLARDKIKATGAETRFRGYDLTKVDYALREFTCHACTNECSIQEFNVEGQKTFWGDKCSDRYRKRLKTHRKPVIPDLCALRNELLQADDTGDSAGATTTIGLPLAMYTWDWLPLWRRFFRDCGFKVVVSTETNRQIAQAGLDAVVAEPCFPIIVAHGHTAELIARGVDYLFIPNLLTTEEKTPGLESYVCPWGQTLPFVLRQAAPFRDWRGRILCPTLNFASGRDAVKKALVGMVAELGVRPRVAARAFAAGLAALDRFRTAYRDAGEQALDKLVEANEPGIVLVGRPYNIHDAGVSLAVARKLRDQYGVNILPVDALPVDGIDVSDVCDNMYWSYGRRILAVGQLVAKHPNLHIIYVTNFKCGPDSFIKGFIRPAANGKPFLTLQFDGHSNDAGMMTRCEAYLDSKGFLRWWKACQTQPAGEVLPAEPSTSPKWRTPVPG
jgi:activator of 2-hydroxyglutaryl-CoA dehydratase/predicted nucleotide-binding protein (sugar kinase/HSP70/actin superfamily)